MPDGKRFIYGQHKRLNSGSELYLMDLSTSSQTKLIEMQSIIHSISISADEKSLIFISEGEIKNYTVETGQVKTIIRTIDDERPFQVTLTPNGKIVYSTRFRNSSSTTLFIADANGNNKKVLIARNSDSHVNLRISSDGKYICYDSGYSIKTCNVDGGNEELIISSSNLETAMAVGYPSWMPEGKTILFTGGSRKSFFSTDGLYMCKINMDGTGLKKYTLSGSSFIVGYVVK